MKNIYLPFAIIFIVHIVFAENDTLNCISRVKLSNLQSFCEDSTLYIKNKFSGQYIHYLNKEFIATVIHLNLKEKLYKYPDVKIEYEKYRNNRNLFWTTFGGGLGLMILSYPISLITKKDLELWPWLLTGGFCIEMSSIVFELKSQNNMTKLVWRLNNNLIIDKFNSINCQK